MQCSTTREMAPGVPLPAGGGTAAKPVLCVPGLFMNSYAFNPHCVHEQARNARHRTGLPAMPSHGCLEAQAQAR